MAHLTAGDMLPLAYKIETTYGVTPGGNYAYYGDIREGGHITPTDNMNPYVNYRYGSNRYNTRDYVAQQQDAGFKDSIEVRDTATWSYILRRAGIRTAGDLTVGEIGSRTILVGYHKSNADQRVLKYNGCKTDELRISADVPGGVVTFEETILASYRDESVTTLPSTIDTASGPAVQWVGGVTSDSATIYPQSFTLTIRNNLGRKEAYDTALGKSKSTAIYEGRQEIEFEMVLWMEDFNHLLANMSDPATFNHNLTLHLGKTNGVTLNISGYYMADGQNTALAQDKQTETVRLRVHNITLATD